jgi:uncharacterized membrane protein
MVNGLTSLTNRLRPPGSGITVTEMQFAVQHGDIEMVRRHYGVAPRVPDTRPESQAGKNPPAAQGLSLLALAATTGNRHMVDALLQLGASPDGIPGQEASPLASAALVGKDEVVQLLLAAGANPLDRNRSGQTARDLAYIRNNRSTVTILQAAERSKALQLSQSLRGFGYDIPATNVWDDDKQRALEQFRREYRSFQEDLLTDWMNKADRNVIRACNAGSQQIAVAQAEQEPGTRTAVLNGYWHVPPGTCRRVPHSAARPNVVYYLYAARGDRPVVRPSAGDPRFCISSQAMNNVRQDVSSNTACPRQNNERAAPFVQVPLGGNASGLMIFR